MEKSLPEIHNLKNSFLNIRSYQANQDLVFSSLGVISTDYLN